MGLTVAGLLFGLSCASPQAPIDELRPVFDAAIAGQELADVAAAAADDLAGAAQVAVRGVKSPHAVDDWRRAGTGSIDRWNVEIDALQGVADAGLLLDLVAGMWAHRVPSVTSRGLDLRGFETLCERAFREVRSAVGSGSEYEAAAAQLHTALDHIRLQAVLDGIDGPTDELIAERFDRVGRVDLPAILLQARRVVAGSLTLSDERLLGKLAREGTKKPRDGVRGDVLEDRDSSFGRIVIGGFGPNEYDCSQVDVIVDLGGDDVYRGPVGGTGEFRRLSVVVDIAGNDRYEALNGGLGAGSYGLGVLIDAAGDDVYRGGDRCLGFGAAGVGVWADLGGADDIEVGALCLGVGLAGIGIASDWAGDDKCVAVSESFGVGMPGGLGLFFDAGGSDQRQLGVVAAGPVALSHPMSIGYGCGLGGRSGERATLAGGLGVFLDAGGAADTYVAGGGMVLGVGAFGGVGLFADIGGADRYDAGAIALGASVDLGIGVAVDRCGDGDEGDRYAAGSLACGAALGHGGGWFADTGGDDAYTAGASAFGSARRGAIAGFFDRDGADRYEQSDVSLQWPGAESATQRAKRAALAVFVESGAGANDFVERARRVIEGGPPQMLEVDWVDGPERRILIHRGP